MNEKSRICCLFWVFFSFFVFHLWYLTLDSAEVGIMNKTQLIKCCKGLVTVYLSLASRKFGISLCESTWAVKNFSQFGLRCHSSYNCLSLFLNSSGFLFSSSIFFIWFIRGWGQFWCFINLLLTVFFLLYLIKLIFFHLLLNLVLLQTFWFDWRNVRIRMTFIFHSNFKKV